MHFDICTSKSVMASSKLQPFTRFRQCVRHVLGEPYSEARLGLRSAFIRQSTLSTLSGSQARAWPRSASSKLSSLLDVWANRHRLRPPSKPPSHFSTSGFIKCTKLSWFWTFGLRTCMRDCRCWMNANCRRCWMSERTKCETVVASRCLS